MAGGGLGGTDCGGPGETPLDPLEDGAGEVGVPGAPLFTCAGAVPGEVGPVGAETAGAGTPPGV